MKLLIALCCAIPTLCYATATDAAPPCTAVAVMNEDQSYSTGIVKDTAGRTVARTWRVTGPVERGGRDDLRVGSELRTGWPVTLGGRECSLVLGR